MPVTPRILLCWGYQRKGWIQAFEDLRDEFDFYYLYFREPGEDQSDLSQTACPKIYWKCFKSGPDLLERVRPSVVVMMSVTSGYGLALNMACTNARIPCLLLQHGLYSDVAEYLKAEKRHLELKGSSPDLLLSFSAIKKKLHVIRFLLKSMNWGDFLNLPILLRYLRLCNTIGSFGAGLRCRFPQRMPDRYLCFSPTGAQIHREIDLAPEDKFEYTGIPEFDRLFSYIQPEVPQNYFVLIDRPYVRNQYQRSSVTETMMNTLYCRLNEYALSRNCLLKIKLHPESYQDDWHLQHNNIIYIRDVELNSLLGQARGIFCAFSTLMLPAIYLRPTFMLMDEDFHSQKEIVETGLAGGASIFELRVSDIHFLQLDRSSRVFQAFVEKYLYRVDGESTRRLAEILRRFSLRALNGTRSSTQRQ